MTFRNKIRSIVYTQFLTAAGPDASPATVASMGAAADDVADAVANSVHDDLVDKLDDFGQAVSSFAAAFAEVTVVPGDGGAAIKAACLSSLDQIQTTASALTSAVGSYK